MVVAAARHSVLYCLDNNFIGSPIVVGGVRALGALLSYRL